MKFSCDRCDAQYMISDEKVGPKGVRVRCKKCGNVIPVRRVAENGALSAEQPAPAVTGRAVAAGGLDAELGQAFDHAFGSASSTPVPGEIEPPDADAAPGPDANAEPLPVEVEPAAAPVGPPAATEWYVAIGQAQVGPLPLEEVRRKWEGSDVGPDSLVWRPGMGDWAPLSSVSELAAYLAPFPTSPRQSRTPPPASARRSDRAPTPAPTPAPGDVSWKPVGASALAALASEEIAARSTPEPRPVTSRGPASAAGGAASVRTLVEQMDLPDGGGVDPTGAIPLPMKALEATGEHRMERISSVARGAEELRQRRNASRGIALGAAAVLLLGGGAAAYWYTSRTPGPAPEPARPPVAASAPLPAAPVPEPVQAQPEPVVAAATAPSEPAKADPATVEPATAEPTKAEAAQAEPAKLAPVAAAPEADKPAAQPAPAAPEAEKAEAPAKVARATAAETRAARREAARLAQRTATAAAAPEAPAPAPRRRDVLDFESNDAALEAALGSAKPSGSRSVYVPPPPTGTALQERVTDSQVNETILGRVSALQQCVQQQKARDADTTGVMKMRWTIAPDGSTRGAKCVTPEFASSQIAQCVSGVLNATRFPRSRLGRQDVTFPIKF